MHFQGGDWRQGPSLGEQLTVPLVPERVISVTRRSGGVNDNPTATVLVRPGDRLGRFPL